VKATVDRIVKSLDAELTDHPVTALGVTPGWLRSEQMLDNFGVTEDNWRDALVNVPGFAISETPTYLGRGVAALAGDPDASRFAGRVLTSRQLRTSTTSPTWMAHGRTAGGTSRRRPGVCVSTIVDSPPFPANHGPDMDPLITCPRTPRPTRRRTAERPTRRDRDRG
jgi:hypothetical protein